MNKAVGKRVKRLRNEKELTQGQLAKKAGVTANTLRGLEKGTLTTRWPKLQKIAKALGTTAEALLHGDEPIAPTDPLLDKLRKEDILIARDYHHSSTLMRQCIAALLRNSDDDEVLTRAVLAIQKMPAHSLDALTQLINEFPDIDFGTLGKKAE